MSIDVLADGLTRAEVYRRLLAAPVRQTWRDVLRAWLRWWMDR